MKKKGISFALRIMILVVFYFLAYEYLLDRSVFNTILVIVFSALPTLIPNAWRWFKKRRSTSDATK